MNLRFKKLRLFLRIKTMAIICSTYKHQNKKVFLGVFLCVLFAGVFSCNSSLANVICNQEEVSFENPSGLKLHGLLSIPDNFRIKNKLIVLVSPPLKFDREYTGLFSFISDSLCKRGFVTFSFDNRSFTFDNIKDGDCSMFDQADDVHAAIKFLKKDTRFKSTSIGLLGHSEGGAAVAIEASKNKDIDFVILLSTMGIAGKELSINQISSNLKYLSEKKDSGVLDLFKKDIENKIDIITSGIEMDSMSVAMKKLTEHLFTAHPEIFGNTDVKTIHAKDSLFWLSRHRLAYTNFDPSAYYDAIKCPVLLIYGNKDERVSYKQNMQNIENIFQSVKKTNYKAIVLKDVNHNYEKLNSLTGDEALPPFVMIHRKKGSHRNFSKELIEIIIGWNFLK